MLQFERMATPELIGQRKKTANDLGHDDGVALPNNLRAKLNYLWLQFYFVTLGSAEGSLQDKSNTAVASDGGLSAYSVLSSLSFL